MLSKEMRRLMILIESNQHDDISDKEIDDDQLKNGNAPGYTYYHGTTEKAWNDFIKQQGLDPNSSKYANSEEEEDPYEGPYHFVYLSLDPGYPEWWCHFVSDQRGENAMILKIRPTPEIEKQFIFNRGEHVRSPVKIPPSCISIYEIFKANSKFAE
jgi:hypothetical protein